MTLPSGLWGEGDPLSPTNLNKRNPAGNFPAKTYHVAWAGGTGTTQINNAIVNAAAGGYTAVFIDASRLPYDASAVTFNNNIQMIREGGFAASEGYDPLAYGVAHLTPTTANDAALQAVYDAAANGPTYTGPRIVRFPAGFFYVNAKPIKVAANITTVGAGTGYSGGANTTTIQGLHGGGPVFLVCGTTTVADLTTSLVSGAGSALQLQGSTRYFNLRDLPSCDLNGLTAFTAECFYKGTTLGASLLGSFGAYFDSDPDFNSVYAFALLVDGAGLLSARLTTTGSGAKIIGSAGPSIVDNAVHHLALSYDGATFRAFVDGALIDSTAMTGTVVQTLAEDVTMGCFVDHAPENTYAAGSGGIIDSPRLSNVARYTAAFTAPTAKFAVDGFDLMFTDFSETVGTAVKAHTKNGYGWLVQRRADTGGASNVGFQGLTITGSGTPAMQTGIYFGAASYYHELHNLSFGGLRYGILCPKGNAYGWFWNQLFFNNTGNNGRYGVVLNSTAGIGQWNTGWLQGYNVGMIASTSPIVLYNIFHQAQTAATYYGMVFPNGVAFPPGPKLIGCNFNAETGVGTQYIAALAYEYAVSLEACGIETGGTTAPAIRAESNQMGSMRECAFVKQGTPASLISITGTTTRPIRIENCDQPNGWISWSNVTGTAVVGQLGTLYSASTGSTLNFDASVADEWDLTLSSDVTQSSWTKISYGQPVSGTIKMDSTGSRLFVWPTNSKGTVTLSYGSAAINTFTGFYDGVNVILTSVRTGL